MDLDVGGNTNGETNQVNNGIKKSKLNGMSHNVHKSSGLIVKFL
jgi:hypothetical protein